MKRTLSLIMALILTMSLVIVSAGAAFTDTATIAYPEAVEQLAELDIIGGYADGSFGPKALLTRGAAAKIICGMMLTADEIAALPTDVAPYPDVAAGSTYAAYIAFLKEKGVIGGYADGTFKPEGTLSKTAFLKMLIGVLGYDATTEGLYGTNGTIKILLKTSTLGLASGSLEYVKGGQDCTREDAALFAYNALNCKPVDYVNGVATAGENTLLEIRYADYVEAKEQAAAAAYTVNEGDKLLTVLGLTCRAKKDTWVVSLVAPEEMNIGPDKATYKFGQAGADAPDGDTWSITIWDKEGGTELGTYTAETNKSADQACNLSIPVSGSAAYKGLSVYAEVTVVCVDDAGNMTARYSYKQTFENIVDYDG